MPKTSKDPDRVSRRKGPEKNRKVRSSRDAVLREPAGTTREAVRLIVSRRAGGAGPQVTLQIAEEPILLGELTAEELHQLQRIVQSDLQLWDPSLEVWVPTPSLLFRWSQGGMPDLSTIGGFRRLAEFLPLTSPDLDDSWLWKKTTLGAFRRDGLVFGIRKDGDVVYWVLPLEDHAFFKLTPATLTSLEPGLFGSLGIDRLIQFLRAAPNPEG